MTHPTVANPGRTYPATTRPATYAYRAARADGVLQLGAVEAASREAASALLSGRGLFPLELRLDHGPKERRERLTARDLALGLRVLATLLDSGLPISRSLSALDDAVPDSWRRALPALRESVREGKSLAAALAAAPLEIPPLVIGIVQAAEAGSGVAHGVRRAAELTEAQAATRAAVRSALAYPLMLAGAGAASIALLVSVVLPRFSAILADLGQTLPPATRIVLGAAATVHAAAIPVLVGMLVLAAVWKVWVSSEVGRARWHDILLALPVVGDIRHAAATARMSAALAALLESGVPISAALAHVVRATGDAALSVRVLAARERVIHGEGIARAIEAECAMTRTAVRLIRAGEETGRLAPMLAHVARLESGRVEETVKRAVRLLEPSLILGAGGGVALVAAALLQAVYSVRPAP